eukprot:CAMPEP_0182827714 /NCGR_PEP_ID=MMETSP0006_2-20121128/17078_1 /TAXON_ID=97485 /ORGANISM="Prymnesium parvum, Strain Texoma1" /LENGTH=104 /DNA_ID=CAMNT_0024955011 /DNA_START=356 /DNA_END=667 /DNA_ORIENTATION=+
MRLRGLSLTELAPDVQQDDESNKKKAEHKHGCRSDFQAGSIVRVEAQDSSAATAADDLPPEVGRRAAAAFLAMGPLAPAAAPAGRLVMVPDDALPSPAIEMTSA